MIEISDHTFTFKNRSLNCYINKLGHDVAWKIR